MHKSISGFPGPSENNGGTDFFTKAFRGIALQMCKYYLIFLNFQWWTTFSINQTYNYFHTMLVFLLYRLQEMIRFVWNASRTSCVSSTTSGVDCGLTTTRNYGCTYSFFFFFEFLQHLTNMLWLTITWLLLFLNQIFGKFCSSSAKNTCYQVSAWVIACSFVYRGLACTDSGRPVF